MKYTVPQFIDVEDKIMGPLTTRQFVIMLVVCLIIALFYKLFDFSGFLLASIPLFSVGVVFAFLRINGQPFHYFLLNVVQTLQRPAIRVWDKAYTDEELRQIIKAPPPEKPKLRIRKEPLAATKLTELSLIVNTGGVYNPED
jgi:hypothetical protein